LRQGNPKCHDRNRRKENVVHRSSLHEISAQDGFAGSGSTSFLRRSGKKRG
jgi:hypothetical protein